MHRMLRIIRETNRELLAGGLCRRRDNNKMGIKRDGDSWHHIQVASNLSAYVICVAILNGLGNHYLSSADLNLDFPKRLSGPKGRPLVVLLVDDWWQAAVEYGTECVSGAALI